MKKPLPFDNTVYVTRPLLNPLEDYLPAMREIWESGWLTNGGAKHVALEKALVEHLRTPYLSLFNNGTIALIVACQALHLSGEVITTPFTFPATPHVLSWNNATPVFADIDPETLTIDPRSIERLITSKTTGILGVHVYGMPCAVHEIERIAQYHGLKVIYDGAHAFGTEIDGVPIGSFGDATMFSFHATKLFHTAEGGALAVGDAALKNRIDLLKNFGIRNEFEVIMPGINGKMNEIQAAIGLVNLKLVDAERAARQKLADVYTCRMNKIPGIRTFNIPNNVRHSLQYFVIRVEEGALITRDVLYDRLKSFNIHARKYFFPLCSDYSCYGNLLSAAKHNLPIAQAAAQEVLVLPLYGALGEEGAHRVSDAIEYLMMGSK